MLIDFIIWTDSNIWSSAFEANVLPKCAFALAVGLEGSTKRILLENQVNFSKTQCIINKSCLKIVVNCRKSNFKIPLSYPTFLDRPMKTWKIYDYFYVDLYRITPRQSVCLKVLLLRKTGIIYILSRVRFILSIILPAFIYNEFCKNECRTSFCCLVDCCRCQW